MKKQPTKRTRSIKEKPKPVLNWLSPEHPFHNTIIPSGLYEQIRDEVLTTDAMWKGHMGGPADKRIKELIPVIEKAKKASHKKTAKEVWRYLEDTLPHFSTEVDGIKQELSLNLPRDIVVMLYDLTPSS